MLLVGMQIYATIKIIATYVSIKFPNNLSL